MLHHLNEVAEHRRVERLKRTKRDEELMMAGEQIRVYAVGAASTVSCTVDIFDNKHGKAKTPDNKRQQGRKLEAEDSALRKSHLDVHRAANNFLVHTKQLRL